MDERARRGYRGMAYGFLGLGAVFVLVTVLERLIGFEFFNASPVRVALLLIAIGGTLLWTVRRRAGEVAEPPPANVGGDGEIGDARGDRSASDDVGGGP